MASQSQRQMLLAGDKAPSVRLRDSATGAERSLEEVLQKGPAVLAFFKVTCPVCQFTFPFLERMSKSGALQFVGVSQDDAESTADFNREFGVTFPTLLDDERRYEASNDFGISHVPSMFLIEPGGAITWASSGFSKKDLEELGRRSGVQPFRPGEYVPEWKSG